MQDEEEDTLVPTNSLFSLYCLSQPGIRACAKARTRQHTRQSAHAGSANTPSNAPESPCDFRLKMFVQRVRAERSMRQTGEYQRGNNGGMGGSWQGGGAAFG